MTYFVPFESVKVEQKHLLRRVYRQSLFEVGDVVSIFFRDPSFNFFFEGLCLALKKPQTPEFSFRLQNVVGGSLVELTLSFYYNRVFFFKVNDFKRKKFYYNHSKLFYLNSKSH